MANIIIPRGDNLGRTRSKQEENMREHWGVRSMTDSQLSKLKYLEKKYEEKTGSRKNFIGLDKVDQVK